MVSPGMTVYLIRNWSLHFENNRTRDLKELRFVILPNKHDGDGYTELLDHPNGAAHYGAWIAIVQVASRGQHPAGGCGIVPGCCECRGILLRDGAKPHDPASLARITRIPEKVFKDVLPRLVAIGWMEQIALKNQADSDIPQEGAGLDAAQNRRGVRESAASIEQNGMEGNGIEKKESIAEQARRVFGFWQDHLEHPRSVFDEKRTNAVTGRLKAGYSPDDLMAAIRGCKNTPYNMGKNPEGKKYDDIELICRDASHVERFMANAEAIEAPRPKTIKEQLETEVVH